MGAGPYIEPNPPRHLVESLKSSLPGSVLEVTEFRGELTVRVPRERIVEIGRFLKEDAEADCVFLSCVLGMHYLERDYDYEVVYELYSLEKNHRLRLKLRLNEGETVPSVTSIWPGANWPEREAFDLVGIRFQGHPDLRRIIMPEDYEDHPLRKDFDVEGGPTDIDPRGRPASRGYRDMEHA